MDNEQLISQEEHHPLIGKLNQVLKSFRGDNTHQLVEAFTSEMTLVAEGLCEDQGRLRTDLENLADENRSLDARYTQEINRLYERLDQDLEKQNKRLETLETRMKEMEKGREEKKVRFGKWQVSGGFLHQLTILVSIAAGSWVLVTLLNLIREMIR